MLGKFGSGTLILGEGMQMASLSEETKIWAKINNRVPINQEKKFF